MFDIILRTIIPILFLMGTGLFAAVEITNVPEKQIVVAAGEGCEAALSVFGCLS